MPHRSSPRAPPTTLNPILLLINLRNLKAINRPLVTVIPVQLADLVLAVKQVHPALTAAAAAGADLTDAIGGDGEAVDVVFGEGFGFVGGGVEVSSAHCK